MTPIACSSEPRVSERGLQGLRSWISGAAFLIPPGGSSQHIPSGPCRGLPGGGGFPPMTDKRPSDWQSSKGLAKSILHDRPARRRAMGMVMRRAMGTEMRRARATDMRRAHLPMQHLPMQHLPMRRARAREMRRARATEMRRAKATEKRRAMGMGTCMHRARATEMHRAMGMGRRRATAMPTGLRCCWWQQPPHTRRTEAPW